mgnify:CR=1 FL=1
MKISFTQRKLCLLIIAASFTFTGSFAQLHCGSTEARQKLIDIDPSILEKEANYEEEIQQIINSHRPGIESVDTGPVYVIPVVFHVLHLYGTENISDAQIFDQVNILNRDYRKLNADTSSIVPVFRPIAADCEIEFRLASKDPDGNCTNGIDRIYTHKTITAHDHSKLNQWDPSKYLNVWVVRSLEITTASAYAYPPSAAAGVNFKKDGIVIINSYVGSIGTSNSNNSRVLTHEIGHWLNLSHPWGSTNNPEVACGDDNVSDTPITKGTYSCNLNLSVCDTPNLENVQNYMDYSFCNRMFTDGQKARMRAALKSATANRKNLWSAANLIATGTDVPPTQVCAPIADFYANKFFICQGAGLGLYGITNKGATTGWSWSMPNGNPSTSTMQSLGVVYSAPAKGWQTVSLTVANASGNDTKTKTTSIYVSQPNGEFQANYSDNFDSQGLFNNYWFPINTGLNASQWGISQTASYTGASCVMLNAYSPTTYDPYYGIVLIPGIGARDVDYLVSPSLDMSWVSNMTMTFRIAYASTASISQDMTETLKVLYSINCGETWNATPVYTKAGANLITAGHSTGLFTPSSQTDWRQESVTLPAILNGKPNVRFKFEYTSGEFSNNLYLDDFNISGAVGIEDGSSQASMDVFPNPGSGNTTLNYNLTTAQNIVVEITDMLGQVVYNQASEYQSAGSKTVTLPTERLGAGVYFVRMISDNKLIAGKKLVMTN